MFRNKEKKGMFWTCQRCVLGSLFVSFFLPPTPTLIEYKFSYTYFYYLFLYSFFSSLPFHIFLLFNFVNIPFTAISCPGNGRGKERIARCTCRRLGPRHSISALWFGWALYWWQEETAYYGSGARKLFIYCK